MQDINTIIDNLGDRFIAVPIKEDFKASLKQQYGVSATYALLKGSTIKEAIENEYEECEGYTLIDSDNDRWGNFLSIIGEVVVPFNESYLFHDWDSLVNMADVLNVLKGENRLIYEYDDAANRSIFFGYISQ